MKRVVLTNYWSGDHETYRKMLHESDTDEFVEQAREPRALAAAIDASGAVDGDEIEIVVRKTGRRPFGNRRYRLTAPGTYEREPFVPNDPE